MEDDNATYSAILPHVKTTLFITGAFCVAWSWDLVVYSISHILAEEDPLDNQLAFGDQPGPKYLWVLLLQYLLVCGGAAALSNRLREADQDSHQDEGWTKAAVMAIEFFPSPVFAGKLMAYLSQFQFNPLQQALINLAATWFSAFWAHLLPLHLSSSNNPLLKRTSFIVRDTLGFGLGISWNVLLSQFGPEDDSQLNLMHFLALTTYLVMVLVIAFKVAVMVKPEQEDAPPPSVWDSHLSLLSFAMYVVCAFTLVGYLNTILDSYSLSLWQASFLSFAILLVLAAITSAMVASADLDEYMPVSQQERPGDDNYYDGNVEPVMPPSNTWEYKSSKFGAFGGVLNCLIFVPCVWCCCPWVPVLILLAGTTESLAVKDHWFQLIAMVAGLACSIEGSSMLTAATDTLAKVLDICSRKHCNKHPWEFVALQVAIALVTTVVLLRVIAPLAPPSTDEDNNHNDASSGANPNDLEGAMTAAAAPAPSAPTEDQALFFQRPSRPSYSSHPPSQNPNYDPNRM